MSELEGAHNRSRLLEQVHSSCRIYSSHISWTDRQKSIRCSALCRRHQSALKVGGEAYVAGVGEHQVTGRLVVRNIGRCDDDGCSCFEPFRKVGGNFQV